MVKVKYTFYEPPDIDVLCRYINSGSVVELLPKALVLLKLILVSNYREIVRVSRVVIPIRGLVVYVAKGFGYPLFSSVRVYIDGSNHAEVVTDGSPPIDGLNWRCSLNGESSSFHHGLRSVKWDSGFSSPVGLRICMIIHVEVEAD